MFVVCLGFCVPLEIVSLIQNAAAQSVRALASHAEGWCSNNSSDRPLEIFETGSDSPTAKHTATGVRR